MHCRPDGQSLYWPLSTRRRSFSSSLGPATLGTGFQPYPPPSVGAHLVRRISSSLARNLNSRFGFGPIIRLQLRLEPLFLPVPQRRERRRPSRRDPAVRPLL